VKFSFPAFYETAYRFGGSTEEWVAGVLGAMAPLFDTGHGMFAQVYDASVAGKLEVSTQWASPEYLPFFAEWAKSGITLDPSVMESMCRRLEFATLRGVIAGSDPSAGYASRLAPIYSIVGIEDVVVINTLDPNRKGCVFFGSRDREAKVTPPEWARLRRVMAHVGAAHRLRSRIAELEVQPDGEAVLDPDGRLHHAEMPAQSDDAQRALRTAVVTLERSRGPIAESSPDEALATCNALTSARWTLVDRFERDGRRYLVAHRNASAVRPSVELSSREKLVSDHARLGRGNKAIAYQLGLSVGAVANYLHRAQVKLGAASRVELIQKLERAASTGD